MIALKVAAHAYAQTALKPGVIFLKLSIVRIITLTAIMIVMAGCSSRRKKLKHKGKSGQKRDKKTQARYNSERHHMINGARKFFSSMIPRPGKLKRQLEAGDITQEQYDAKINKANAATEQWRKTTGLKTAHHH